MEVRLLHIWDVRGEGITLTDQEMSETDAITNYPGPSSANTRPLMRKKSFLSSLGGRLHAVLPDLVKGLYSPPLSAGKPWRTPRCLKGMRYKTCSMCSKL